MNCHPGRKRRICNPRCHPERGEGSATSIGRCNTGQDASKSCGGREGKRVVPPPRDQAMLPILPGQHCLGSRSGSTPHFPAAPPTHRDSSEARQATRGSGRCSTRAHWGSAEAGTCPEREPRHYCPGSFGNSGWSREGQEPASALAVPWSVQAMCVASIGLAPPLLFLV